jgi:hypothetical protein
MKVHEVGYTGHREPYRPDDFLVARGETRRRRAARRRIERCGDGVEQVRKALFELVDQVVDEPAYT